MDQTVHFKESGRYSQHLAVESKERYPEEFTDSSGMLYQRCMPTYQYLCERGYGMRQQRTEKIFKKESSEGVKRAPSSRE